MEIRTTPTFLQLHRKRVHRQSDAEKAGIKKGRLIEIIGNLNLRPYGTDEGIRQISADVGFPRVAPYWFKAEGDEADSSRVRQNRTEEHR